MGVVGYIIPLGFIESTLDLCVIVVSFYNPPPLSETRCYPTILILSVYTSYLSLFYTDMFLGLKILLSKVRKFATKIASRQKGVKFFTQIASRQNGVNSSHLKNSSHVPQVTNMRYEFLLRFLLSLIALVAVALIKKWMRPAPRSPLGRPHHLISLQLP